MKLSINALRFLGLDQTNEAASGHPGIDLGAAPVVYELFTNHLNATPSKSDWFDRDRFVLSAGHGSSLLYALYHLAGYNITMDDLKGFRQAGSITPGHPEYGLTDGVEATTGPLGQGISMSVGMAIAEENLRARFNKDDLKVVDHYTYTLCGDGDLQEGVTQEAMSLAGHLGLSRLIVLYDSNDVQLDGPTKDANSENMKLKAEAINWNYDFVEDANDLDALNKAIKNAKDSDKPTLIEIKSVIGFGSSVAGTNAAHGKPIGKEETEKMRKDFEYPYGPFEEPTEAIEDFKNTFKKRGDEAVSKWEETLKAYKGKYPEDYETFMSIVENRFNVNWDDLLGTAEIGTSEATRATMGSILPKVSEAIPSMIGGSADLSGSTKVTGNDGNFTKENYAGRNINFGVREHAMGAIVNGLNLHNMRGFSGGFFIFSDYMKPALRLAALQELPATFIFTHDSVAVGEDGPTHEPIEQLSMFRAMPNMTTIRPANAVETRHALHYALESSLTPTSIVLTRQGTEVLEDVSYEDFKKGAYIVRDKENFEGILIATGSEVELALHAQEALAQEGVNVRVVSMPSQELFNAQNATYKQKVLPSSVTKRVAVELGAPDSWYRYAENVYALDRYGMSAPGDTVLETLGFTPDALMEYYRSL
ncbi:MAG: transketolase [Bacillota bacterium]